MIIHMPYGDKYLVDEANGVDKGEFVKLKGSFYPCETIEFETV